MFFLLFQLKFTLRKYSYKMLLENIFQAERRDGHSQIQFQRFYPMMSLALCPSFTFIAHYLIYLEVTNLYYDQISNSIILVFSSTKLVRFIQLWIIKFISVKRLYWLLGKIFYMLINLLVDTNICNKVLYILGILITCIQLLLSGTYL